MSTESGARLGALVPVVSQDLVGPLTSKSKDKENKNMKNDKGTIIQVKIRDVLPNPYRDYSLYSIRADKVARLVESIRETGFWENVVGRRKGNKVEIAYGHHRIEAARKVFKPDDTIPIIIKDLSDDDMLRMMIRENAEEYGCPLPAIDDAVKGARDFLTANPDVARGLLSSDGSEVKRVRIGAPVIAKYSGFSESTVERSLERIRRIEAGKVDKQAVYMMPSAAAADRFVKYALAATKALAPDGQRAIAKRIVKEGMFGEASIKQTFQIFVPLVKKTDPYSAYYYDSILKKATRQIEELIRTLLPFNNLNQTVVFDNGIVSAEDVSQRTLDNFDEMALRLGDVMKSVADDLDKKKKHPVLTCRADDSEPCPPDTSEGLH
jgi:hypothetical protein